MESIVFNEDCIQVMKRYPDKWFDLAVVDPPYGLDLANMNMGAGKSKKASKIKNRKWYPKDWDKETPTPEYFAQLFRVSKNQIIWGGNYFDLPPCKNYIIWDKEIPEGLSFADCEMAWTSFNKSARIFDFWNSRLIGFMNPNRFHPTEKPIDLYKWLLQNNAKEGDKILDTHLGSGSIAIACHDYGFDLTACELDKEYYDKAIQRINNHVSQQKLF